MINTQIPSLRHCTGCDTALPADAHFCVECGATAAASSAAQPTIALRHTPVATTIGVRCTTCGTANPAGAAFCVGCGVATTGAPVPAGYIPQERMPFAPSYAGGAIVYNNIYLTNTQPATIPLLVRAIWFLFVGLWLGPLWIMLGWLINLTVIGLPLGVWMLNRTGNVMTLKQTAPQDHAGIGASSASLAVRAVYFALIGWWASLVWLMFGWLAAATVIGLPLAFLMFEKTGMVLTLAEA